MSNFLFRIFSWRITDEQLGPFICGMVSGLLISIIIVSVSEKQTNFRIKQEVIKELKLEGYIK